MIMLIWLRGENETCNGRSRVKLVILLVCQKFLLIFRCRWMGYCWAGSDSGGAVGAAG